MNFVRILGAAVSAVCLAAAPVAAQNPVAAPVLSQASPPALRTLDAETRRAVVDAAAEALRQGYVYPDIGEQAAAAIEAALEAGAYDGVTEPWAFADRLTEDLQAVSHDKHMNVATNVPRPISPGAARAPVPRPRSDGGVARADILPGNVGYIEIVSLPPLDQFQPPADRAMAGLADTRALIVDVRRNTGGSPVPETYFASYFIDSEEPVEVNRFVWRNQGTDTFRIDNFFSSQTPFSYAGKPVYVLTSGVTFSGGEAVAYDMQALGLATVVGEVTGGGAHPGASVPLASGFMMFVPGGRGENPTTGTNWEGVGVTPDIAAPADQALRVALAELGVAADETDIDALSQAQVFALRATPQPGAADAVRRIADELARGAPDYDLMTPAMAERTRQQLPMQQGMFERFGPIESVTFREVDAQGLDVYDVRFANGAEAVWMITLDPDGKVSMSGFRMEQPLILGAPPQ